MFSGRTTTTVSAPAQGPMDLNQGKPDWRELLPLMGLALLGVIIAWMGATIFMWNLPTTPDQMTRWQLISVVGGGLCTWAGVKWFLGLGGEITAGVSDFRQRRRDWHDAQLDKFIGSDGQVIAQQISEWSYNPLDLRSLLLAYAAILFAQPRQLTIDQLCSQGLWLRIEHHDMKILDFTQDSAAQFLDLMAEARVIQGRKPRVAGSIMIDQPKEQIGRLLKLASRDPSVLATMQTLEG